MPLIRPLYVLFISFFIKFVSFWDVLVKNPQIKKCHLTCLSETSCVQISKRTSFPVRVDGWRVSLVSSCSWGSTRMSLHISFKSLAVIFWIWLWGIEIKPPFLNDKACCRANLRPHSQLVGNLRGAHPCLIWIRSQNSFLLFF